MKKLLFLIALVFVLCSCSNVLDNRVGSVQFSASNSRGITASIDYPSLLDKVWNLTATKLDGGEKVGEGEYTELLLTDSIGLFSVGNWRFMIIDTEGKITGSVETTINAGVNVIPITVRSTASKGTLSIEDCNFLESKVGAKVNYVDCYVDDQRINGTEWVVSDSMTTDGDLFTLPTITTQLAGGTHTVRLYYGADNGGFSSETVRIRVVNGMTTHFTIGEQEGNLTVTIAFDVVGAIE